MIEIKVSQGAKPGHGGILPGAKVTHEIAETRLVAEGKDVMSPTYHKAFSTPSGDDGVHRSAARALRAASRSGSRSASATRGSSWRSSRRCIETGIHADFIVVDGGEGGTGAAPLEFSNAMGAPLLEGLVAGPAARSSARGSATRSRIGASGKLVTGGADLRRAERLGADWCNSARGVHVLGRLHPGPALPHQSLPGRRDDAGPEAAAGARRARTRPSASTTSTATRCTRWPR